MKSHELVERINNGEIKDGMKIKSFGKADNGEYEVNYLTYTSGTLMYDLGLVSVRGLLNPNIEFEIVEEHKGWFKPEKGEEYWYIEDGYVFSYRWHEECEDLYRYKHHNVFRNPKEAQECLDYKNALKEAEKPFKYNKTNYCLAYNKECDDIRIAFDCHYEVQGITYLGQDEDAVQAFIDKWHDEILKYEFDVWEEK